MAGSQSRPSPFLDPGATSSADSLAILHVKRDLLLPTSLSEHDENDEGYDEGRVTNTRFGSFPHSTLIGLPWGSQVRASNVDTGSRGRKSKQNSSRKRKRGQDAAEMVAAEAEQDAYSPGPTKTPVAASTGFIHVLPPTPELWTSALPHRTQVVYTPDYSYILHRLRVRPGSTIIEAGAGSGSFSHAAARAVFNGYPEIDSDGMQSHTGEGKRRGKVLSYEFHDQRVEKLRAEIKQHGLEEIMEIKHRDVCRDGFLSETVPQGTSPTPEAEAIFLDLPAPWLALPHLSRSSVPGLSSVGSGSSSPAASSRPRGRSPLNPNTAVRICTFSPCIEQVQRTIATLRQLGWTEIDMVEISHRRLDIRRERVGLQEEGTRGVNSSAATVDEALGRLQEIEGRFKTFHQGTEEGPEADPDGEVSEQRVADIDGHVPSLPSGKLSGRSRLVDGIVSRKIYKEGRLIHRSEPDLKTHTSYLVFAILPREWTSEDEEQARKQWPVKETETEQDTSTSNSKRSKKQARKAAATKIEVFRPLNDNADLKGTEVTEDERVAAVEYVVDTNLDQQ